MYYRKEFLNKLCCENWIIRCKILFFLVIFFYRKIFKIDGRFYKNIKNFENIRLNRFIFSCDWMFDKIIYRRFVSVDL